MLLGRTAESYQPSLVKEAPRNRSSNAVNFGCGLVGVRLRDYVLATAIGIVPGTFVYQFLFAKFGRKILTEGFRLAYLQDPQLWLALGLFAAFVIVGKWL